MIRDTGLHTPEREDAGTLDSKQGDHKTLEHFEMRGSFLYFLTTLPYIYGTVNPEYFVCMLFSYISYPAASVRKENACERYKASLRIRSGQRLYENFMRAKGGRAQDTKIE